ncbi:MAG: hypothetical protein Q7U60_03020 [Candidatus Methanoperedens sp.]|nr:hypothetical protein [Candidatus Methanoperedens sp.]
MQPLGALTAKSAKNAKLRSNFYRQNNELKTNLYELSGAITALRRRLGRR